jgi:hypothetical protein
MQHASTRALATGLLLLTTAGCGTPKGATTTTASAQADATQQAPALTGFVLTFRSGEASRDATSTTSTWTVDGGRVRVAVRSEGRDAGQPGREPRDADGDVSDIDAVLAQAASAAALVPAAAKAPELVDVTYREICLEHAGERRCAWQVGDAPADDGFRALASLESRLTTYVILPP